MPGTTHTAAKAYHGTLTAGQVDTITITGGGELVQVINRSGAAEIYFTYGFGPDAAPATPVVGADDTMVIPASAGIFELDDLEASTVVVKLISSGAPTYSVLAP